MPRISFNRPQLVGSEHAYIDQALASAMLSGNGEFCQRCATCLEQRLRARRVLMVPSCTAALEMAAVLAGVGPGDEVVVPSFTFVSVANAFALRGAVPVFADVRPDTLNLSADAVADAITERTRAVVVVHYGGVACEMESIMALAERHGLMVIEDAAHSLPASYRGRPLGSLGHLAAFSFHETKNVQCGEGGALAINVEGLSGRAEILQEKGTDRARFFRGEVDKYTWRDIGSSYLLSELSAAFLWAQLERIDEITEARRAIWRRYHQAFQPLESAGLIRRPVIPDGCAHSAHVYYLLVPHRDMRDRLIAALGHRGVQAVFHYVPLHDSPAGRRLGRSAGRLPVSADIAARLIRLPLWAGLRHEEVDTVIEATLDCVEAVCAPSKTSQFAD